MKDRAHRYLIHAWFPIATAMVFSAACMEGPVHPEPIIQEAEPAAANELLAEIATGSLSVDSQTLFDALPTCLTDAQCPGPFGCVDNECQGCVEEGVCPFSGGICDTETGRCIQPDDCQYNSELCMAPTGVCVSDTEGGSHCVPCVTDGHCPGGQICDWNPETNSGQCMASDDCFATGRCDFCVQTGECDAPPGSVCLNPSACANGMTCDPNSFLCTRVECDDVDAFAAIQSDVGAAPLQRGEYSGLTVCPRNHDRFVFNVQPGDWVQISLSSEVGAEVGLVVEHPGFGRSFPALHDHERQQRVITFESFPEELVWEGNHGMLRVWPVGELEGAAYSLSVEVD